jgi:hypothetical protein
MFLSLHFPAFYVCPRILFVCPTVFLSPGFPAIAGDLGDLGDPIPLSYRAEPERMRRRSRDIPKNANHDHAVFQITALKFAKVRVQSRTTPQSIQSLANECPYLLGNKLICLMLS